MRKRALLFVISAGWIAFWFWAFSFAFSDSFFEYDRHSRIPVFLAALVCVSIIPASVLLVWRQVVERRRSSVAALVIHLLTTLGALALPMAVTHVLARAPQPWHLEADDAMGVGIYMAVLFLVATLSVIFLAVALVIRRTRRQSANRRDT